MVSSRTNIAFELSYFRFLLSREFAFPLFTFDLAPVKFLVATCLNTQTIFTMKLKETIAQFEQESNHYMVLKKPRRIDRHVTVNRFKNVSAYRGKKATSFLQFYLFAAKYKTILYLMKRINIIFLL